MRISHQSKGAIPATRMAGDELRDNLFRILVNRCQNLEKSQAKLREEFDELVQEKNTRDEEVVSNSDSRMGLIPGFFLSGTPYKSLLNSIGHAVHVFRVSSGEIIFWNSSAEKLYGWKDYEIHGHAVDELLISEEHCESLRTITENLRTGRPWSGQFPFKKRSGEIFMALVTKSQLYEDGELAGIITVSSDAAIFITMKAENLRTSHFRVQDSNSKKNQWHPRPPTVPVPKIASSVSNLTSKVFSRTRRHEDDTCNPHVFSRDSTAASKDEKFAKPISSEPKPNSGSHHGESKVVEGRSEKDDSTIEHAQPFKIAAKVLGKVQIRRKGKNGTTDNSASNEVKKEHESPRSSDALNSHFFFSDREVKGETPQKTRPSSVMKQEDKEVFGHKSPSDSKESSFVVASRECNVFLCAPGPGNNFSTLGFQDFPKTLETEAPNMEVKDELKKKQEIPSSGQSDGNKGSSLSKGDAESNSTAECEIRWEDLRLGEVIGQGSFAIVYRGLWNGSDVAVKVHFGNGYIEGTLQDYKKEIDIMKRLRHPNVLLFMGAVYSQERLAIVTEFLPRGSLFKTLNKNNQTLDIRRRLRMALDVAKGMNYLHHRNPPIVHRDLKSSNLLVDRNWTVKVGDFGLSRLKEATFLTARSGRGTPQWMAPEVLRNELSNEKSDLFSFGVILWELMTECIPWSSLNSLQVVGVVGFMDRRLDLPEGLDPHVASIIHDCWRSDPEQRPSFEEIIQRMLCLIN
ncbi:Tyrosine kinase [Quillaja saponaria]|uniref:non-specific serine/threonine protein kinase n=1 Tax=Quillaja saponaria TaxID=32244 RepID=A0AAD7L7N2_QUISA|nr:Tyrosine kinase [Quillaja saponaria]